MFKLNTFLVDAFSAKPYCGNPAAVCLVPFPQSRCPISDDELQRIAFELNYSETVFVFLPRNEDEDQATAAIVGGESTAITVLDEGNEKGRGFKANKVNGAAAAVAAASVVAEGAKLAGDSAGASVAVGAGTGMSAAAAAAATKDLTLCYPEAKKHQQSFGIRWFSPRREIGLCGHATLSAAHILFTTLPKVFDFKQPASSDLLRFLVPDTTETLFFVSRKAGVLPVKRQPPSSAGAQVVGGNDLQAQQQASSSSSVTIVNPSVAAIDSTTYQLDFPARMPQPLQVEPKADLKPASGGKKEAATIVFSEERLCALGNVFGITRDRIESIHIHTGSQKYLVVLKSIYDVTSAVLKSAKGIRAVFNDDEAAYGSVSVPVQPLSVTLTALITPEDRKLTTAHHQQQEQGVAKSAVATSNTTSSSGIRIPEEVLDDCTCVSRHFAPWVGIKEDPVTGAAHVVLAPFWCKYTRAQGVLGYQASARGGFVNCRLSDEAFAGLVLNPTNNDSEVQNPRIFLSGNAVTVMEGAMNVQLKDVANTNPIISKL